MASSFDSLARAMQEHQAGNLAEAEHLYRQILQANPADPNAVEIRVQLASVYLGLAAALATQGKGDEALAAHEQGFQLGLSLARQGRFVEAEACLREAARLLPGRVDLVNYLGAVLVEQGRFDEGLALFEKALQLRPDFAEAHCHVGLTRARQGRHEESRAAFEQAVRLKPDYPDALNHLANALRLLGRQDEAETWLRQSLRVRPDLALTWYYLGLVLQAQGKTDEELSCYEQALRIDPQYADVWNNLGSKLKDQGWVEEAIACHRQAVAARPDVACFQSNLLQTLRYQEAYDPEAIFAEHLRWGRQFPPCVSAHANPRDPRRRLRIGYVTAGLNDHGVGRYNEAVLGAHDRSQVEVFCYANVPRPDALTRRVQARVDHWRPIVALNDAQAAELIRQDQIDILVDVGGHSANNRLGVFAEKPAPVQVTHIGYQDTTGLPAIDYRFTDAYCDPPGLTEHLNVEKLVRLPDVQWCYGPAFDVPVGPLPAEQSGQVTFGSLNNLAKVTGRMIGLWARILKTLPSAGLVLVAGMGSAGDERVRASFREHGVDLARVRLVPWQPPELFLRLHHLVDICLDTFPFTGYQTTTDSLWMGVSVVSLAGRTALTRQGVSLLSQVHLENLVAQTADDYVRIAVGLAQDLPRLRALRAGLRDRLKRSPLMDIQGHVRNLEAAYRAIWRRYCEAEGNIGGTAQSDVEATYQLGLSLARQGKYAEAEACLREALRLLPGRADVLNYLGAVLVEQGRFEEGLALFEQALQLRPDFAEAHYHLGLTRARQGRHQESRAAFEQAVRLKPDYPDALNNLANALRLLGRQDEAEAWLRQSLRVRPDLALTWYYLGLVLQAQERTDEELSCYEQALRIDPQYADVWNNLGIKLKDQGRVEEAVACFRKAVAARPDILAFQSNLLLTLNYPEPYDPEAIFAEHQQWGRQFPMVPATTRQTGDHTPGRRLRIGYVSADFRKHPVGRFSHAVIAAHDRAQFEVFCYANVAESDAMTERIQARADHWRSLVSLSDRQAAELIRRDQLDLLIDLSGHTGGNRLGVFALRPAPVQVSHFGYIATTGLPAIDYRLTHAYCDPPGLTERYHTEKLMRLPEVQWCYVAPHETSVAPLPAQRAGAVTFGSFNNVAKITESMLGLWAQILHALPDSRLLVLTGVDRAGPVRIRAALKQFRIADEQVELLGQQPFEAYLQQYSRVDIALDTYPHTGCLTTADALWMGVPVVSRAGPTYVTRQGLGILAQVGLDDLVAPTSEKYVAIAVQLAQDLARLQTLRSELRQRLERSPLLNVQRFTRNLENAYRSMAMRK